MVSSLTVAASTLLCFAAAAPIQDRILSGSLEARQAPSCNVGLQIGDLAAYDSSCWNTLNIMPYLTNWKATTPTCTDAENNAGQTLSCCGASEPWSTCFLRLATKQLNVYDCTQLATTESGHLCSLGTNGGRAFALDLGLDPTIASQVNYVVLNIIMINNFFTTYYTGQLLLRVGLDLQVLIIKLALQNVTVNEEKSLNSLLSSSALNNLNLMNVGVDLQNVMAALTLGLAFPEVHISLTYTVITHNINPSKVSTPRVGTVSSDGTTTTSTNPTKRDPQTSDSGTSLSSAPASSVSILAGSCTLSWLAAYYQDGRHHRRQQQVTCVNGSQTESDPNASLSAPAALDPTSPPVVIFNQALQQSPNVASAMWPSTLNTATDTLKNLASAPIANSASFGPILTAGLQLIMNDVGTFIAFAGNGLFSTPMPSTNEPSAYTSGFTGALDTYILSEILAKNSISATPGSIVTADPCPSAPVCTSSYWSPVTGRQYSFTGSRTASLINEAVATMEVDLPVLFDGAYNCTLAGQAGGSVVSLKADGSLNMACLSVLPMYVGKSGCPGGAVWVDGKCPFG